MFRLQNQKELSEAGIYYLLAIMTLGRLLILLNLTSLICKTEHDNDSVWSCYKVQWRHLESKQQTQLIIANNHSMVENSLLLDTWWAALHTV